MLRGGRRSVVELAFWASVKKPSLVKLRLWRFGWCVDRERVYPNLLALPVERPSL
jgi:hypothetical protein